MSSHNLLDYPRTYRIIPVCQTIGNQYLSSISCYCLAILDLLNVFVYTFSDCVYEIY